MSSQAATTRLGFFLVASSLLATSCRTPATAEPLDDVTSAASAQEHDVQETASARTFHLEPIETADEDPQFSPALVATAEPGGPRDVVRFAWEAPCRVPIRHYNYRNDQGGSLMRMTLDFERANEGYRVRLADFAFETIAGQAADSPEIAEEVKHIQTTAAATMPVFYVSPKGIFESISDVDDMIEFVIGEYGSEVSDEVAQMLRQPAFKQQLTVVAGDYWRSWIELWHGLELSAGESLTQRRRLPFFGTPFEVDLEITHLGSLDAAPNLRLYQARQVLEGPEPERAMLELLRRLAKQTGGPPVPDDAVPSFRRETTMYIAIDPQGAKPHRARRVMVYEIGDTRRVEVTDWAFDWSNAQGCGN